MASDQSFVDYVCEQLRSVRGITHRKMFGEYAIYADEKVVALVCDNQLFLKPTEGGRALLGKPVEAPAYPGAKPSFLIESHLDDADFLAELVRVTVRELPAAKAKSKSAKAITKKTTVKKGTAKTTKKAKPTARKKAR